MPLGKECKTYF